LGIGDWGLGIGDWAQSPIPNPHKIIYNNHIKQKKVVFNLIQYFNKKINIISKK